MTFHSLFSTTSPLNHNFNIFVFILFYKYKIVISTEK